MSSTVNAPRSSNRSATDGASTRERLLEAAVALFAARGFYGTSIRDLAAAVGISKASLIHHFPTKESLYSEVLQRIAIGLNRCLDAAVAQPGDAWGRLHGFVDRFCAWSVAHEDDARILMRELLDNPQRLDAARTWHLKPMMDGLLSLIADGQATGCFRRTEALPVVLLLLGGRHYATLAAPTLARIYSPLASGRLVSQQAALLKHMLAGELATGGVPDAVA